jgi:hypothetical protein
MVTGSQLGRKKFLPANSSNLSGRAQALRFVANRDHQRACPLPLQNGLEVAGQKLSAHDYQIFLEPAKPPMEVFPQKLNWARSSAMLPDWRAGSWPFLN